MLFLQMAGVVSSVGLVRRLADDRQEQNSFKDKGR
jgi:hypothetical protein